MAQGYSGYNIINSEFSIKDSANLDAFSRLRVSNPLILHNSHLTYDLCPLVYESITSASGGGTATITHDTTNRCANINFTSTLNNNCKAYMQSYEYLPYQPGRSQLVFITFNFESSATNVTKFAGYSDGVNGIEFQLVGSTPQFIVYSGTSAGNETVIQSSWNLDKLNGTGPSGITLDVTKTQILVIDIQALYTGRVRIGFDVGGKIIYAHEFKHANLIAYPYIQTATLPVRCGMISTGTVSSNTSMKFICSAVISEGGTEDISAFGYTFSVNSSVNATTSGAHLFTVRPKTTFNGITNRSKLFLVDLEIFNGGSTGSEIRWDLCIGQTLTGTTTFTDINSTYSSSEINKTGVLSGSPEIVLSSGWVAAGTGGKGDSQVSTINSKYPITLNQAGANRTLGALTLKVTSFSGTPVVYGNLKFKEIR